MNIANLIVMLREQGIKLEAHDDRLRYFPKSAVTKDLVLRMQAQKAELLVMLRQEVTTPEETKTDASATVMGFPVCHCGSTTWRDVVLHHPPHNGTSIRRDCGKCRRFIEFPKWYELDN